MSMDTRTAARGLAWFGIGLGIAEVLALRRLARMTGLDGHARLIRLYGWREIASGAAMLTADEPERRLGLRVVGDALDGGLLATGLKPSNPARARTLAAALAVAPVVALDLIYWRKAMRSDPSTPSTPSAYRSR